MSVLNEDKKDIECPLVTKYQQLLRRPRSIVWLSFHGILYTTGGLCFVPASCMYYTTVLRAYSNAFTLAGWLYSIGSLSLLLADLQETWHYRIGCLFDCKYQRVLESDKHLSCQYRCHSFSSRIKRAQLGLNSFASAGGSAMYLAGSILSIPGFESYLLESQYFIIIGSSFIFSSELVKLLRKACTDPFDPFDRRFSISNLFDDLVVFSTSIFAATGAIFFFIGTIFFFPEQNTNDFGQNRAATLYLFGGLGFAFSGFFLLYDHYRLQRNK